MVRRHISLLLLSLITALNAFQDSVITAKLNEPIPKESSAISKNIRLISVLNLMQQKWELYEDHWYKLFEIELMWIPAENFCRQLGGSLVSIKDAAENDFVHRLRKKNNVWIGLNKLKDVRSAYEWSDGSPVIYLNWDSTQPNEPHVHCVYMAFNQDHGGTWFDYACRQKLPQYFVCELKF